MCLFPVMIFLRKQRLPKFEVCLEKVRNRQDKGIEINSKTFNRWQLVLKWFDDWI